MLLSLFLVTAAIGLADEPWLALVDVSVVDVVRDEVRAHQTLLLRGETIASVGPVADIEVPPGARVVALGTGFALPGLWDMHVHLTDATELALPVLLAHGVTGVRDMGGDLERLDRWKHELDTGLRVGPRIARCGPYLDGPKPGLPYRVTITTADEARAAVRELAGRVDFLKVHNLVPRDAYLAMAEEARARGLAFAGHVPIALSPVEVAEAGQRSIEHLTSIFEGRFVEPKPTDQRALLEAISAYPDDGGRELVRALREHGTWIVPNLVAVATRARRTELARDPDPRVRWIPRSLRAQWDEYFPVRDEDGRADVVAARTRFLDDMLAFTRRLHDGGVPLLLGTDLGLRDVFPGASVRDELELLVRAGLTPAEALRAATLEPARWLGQEERCGTLAAGKLGDLVLLGANPLERVDALEQRLGVLSRGRWYGRDELDTWLRAAAERAEKL